MSDSITVDDSNFDQKVLQTSETVLVDFWAPWCHPCRMLAPVLDELAEEYRGKITFARINIDQNPKTTSRYQIMSIPSLLIFKKGKPVSHIVGYKSKAELKRQLDSPSA